MKLEPVWVRSKNLEELADKRVASVGASLHKERPSEQFTRLVHIPEGYTVVPVEPTDAMWGVLALDIKRRTDTVQ